MIALDTTVHIGEALSIIGVGLAALRKLDRILSILQDFPPHKHINGKIVYPKDYAPGVIQELGLS
jgi:hypothetical protein